MVTKILQRNLLFPSLMFLIFFSSLLKLGHWQLERKIWKEEVLQQISSRTKSEPLDLDLFLKQKKITEHLRSPTDLDYYPIKIRGHYLHNKEMFYYAPDQNFGSGYHLYTPFQIKGSDKILMVNRGFVPDPNKDQKSRADNLDEGEVEISGLLRSPGKQTLFVPNNDIARNLWFWRDLEGMMRTSFGENPPPYYPFFLDTFKQKKEGWPQGGVTLLNLPNRHLEYALTWFGLAFALFIIYSVYVVSHFRHKPTPSSRFKS